MFTGKPVSQTTGLYYYGARWYDPSIGRFISPDPKKGHLSNPQTLNLYIYAIDQPTGITDPSGMDGCWIFSTVCNTVSSGASTLYNGAVTAGNDVVNEWNNDPNFRAGVILTLGTIAIVATAGIAAPAVLPAIAVGIGLGAGITTGVYVGTTLATGGQVTASGLFLAASTGAFLGAATAGAGEWLSAARGASSLAEEGSGLQYSDYFVKSDHLQDIAGKFVGDRLDFQSAENLIQNTLNTGQLTEVDGSFQTYEQVFGTLTEKPMGLRVIWNVLEWEVRNAYPFPV